MRSWLKQLAGALAITVCLGGLSGCPVKPALPLPQGWPVSGLSFPPGTKVVLVTEHPDSWSVEVDFPAGWNALNAHITEQMRGLGYSPSSDTRRGVTWSSTLFTSKDGKYVSSLESNDRDDPLLEGVKKGQFVFTVETREHYEAYGNRWPVD